MTVMRLALLVLLAPMVCVDASSEVVLKQSSGQKYRVQALSCTLLRVEKAANDDTFENRETFLVQNRSWTGMEVKRLNHSHASTGCYSVSVDAGDAGAIAVYSASGAVLWQADSLAKVSAQTPMPAPSQRFDIWAVSDRPRFAVPAQGAVPAGIGKFDLGEESEDVYFWITPVHEKLPYKALRTDFLALTGPVPLLPDSALGLWFTWYHNYSAQEKLAEIAEFAARGFKLDIASLDMDWRLHPCYPNSLTPNCTDTPPETERHYVVNKELFPDMKGFLAQVHKLNVSMFFNDHPMTPTNLPGDFNETSPKEIQYRFDGLTSIMDDGLDFWWFDCHWHELIPGIQCPEKKYGCDGVDYAAWGQYVFTSIMKEYNLAGRGPPGRKKQRTMMLGCSNSPHRANHRTPVWWTGDNYYDALALGVEQMVDSGIDLKPWVHQDCAGHHGPGWKLKKFYPYPPEVYMRWVQFCSMGTITRLHSDPSQSRLPWMYGPNAENVSRSFLAMRQKLGPTLVAAARKAHLDGTPIVRRCDFEWPELADKGSSLSSQYLLADDLLVRPVDPFDGIPLKNKTMHTYHTKGGAYNRNASVWLPPGEWHDAFTGELLKGDRNITLTGLPLNRMPLFHRGGGMVLTSAGRDAGQWQEIGLEVWPTRTAFQGSVAKVWPSVSRVLYATDEADLAGDLQPWVVTKTEFGSGFELLFSVGGFQTAPWLLRVHLPDHGINVDAAKVLCNGQVMKWTVRQVNQDLHLITPLLTKEVPSLSPGAVLEVGIDFQRFAATATKVSCKIDMPNKVHFI